jgi:hypothetical protein
VIERLVTSGTVSLDGGTQPAVDNRAASPPCWYFFCHENTEGRPIPRLGGPVIRHGAHPSFHGSR